METYRTTGLLDLDEAKQRKLLVLGYGSLGSLAVGNLPYQFRQTVLVDPERLEAENVERHLHGYDSFNEPKVIAGKRWLVNNKGVDPDTVVVHMGVAEDILHEHTDADLVLVNIDNKDVLKVINSWCVEHNIPALYGSIMPFGRGGHVKVLPAPQDICLLCAGERFGEHEYQGVDVDDYGIDPRTLVDDSGNLKAVPALKWSINSVASDMAMFALNILFNGGEQSQIFFHAHNWESILIIRGTSLIRIIARFIEQHGVLGLIPNMRLRRVPDVGVAIEIRRQTAPLVLEQWSSCPLHGESISMDDI